MAFIKPYKILHDKAKEDFKENNIHIDIDTEALIKLTEYSVDGRYDIIHDDMEDADKYIDILEKLSLHVEKTILKEGN